MGWENPPQEECGGKSMKKIGFKYLFYILLILAFHGCATVPTNEELANKDYGRYPENYQEIVKRYFSGQLSDPYSAQYRWIKPPYQGYFIEHTNLLTGQPDKFSFGYLVHVGINAKNRFGGYIGEKEYVVLIRNDIVIKWE